MASARGRAEEPRASGGMTTPTPPEIPDVAPELLERVIRYFSPRRVILFGSRARGQARADSDTDLLVILDDDAASEQLTLRAGWEARRGYDRATDVIPVRNCVYERKARIVGTLAYEASLDGVSVYERD